ncbi:site-specific recombinase XerD [Elizabethkingia sp. YR214]|uniref:site-specific integrase n=1 Tax=Elizabethkingia sp. YR214 TaxID=2135667 RepID=UPI000D4A97C4|nr:site-specific integrase [Elizabethkingia sp. YR214]PUB29440.1 site-specific recombinase XerD [Elizabethkingia sp. YR214]
MAKVTLRHKPIGKGRKSLYLDIYPPIQSETTGKLLRKFYLKLYIYNRPKSEFEKLHNKKTASLAQHVRAQRQIDLDNADYGFLIKTKLNADFVEFFQKEADKRPGSVHWSMAVTYFKKFVGKVFLFKYLNETLCEAYKNYLLSSPALGRSKRKIQKNTASTYFSRFKSVLKKAYRNKYISADLGNAIYNIKMDDTHRPYLFKDELQKMANSECSSPIVKKAGLFSALTGLRFCDIENLKWCDIQGTSGNYYILYKQNKTGKAEYYPISDDTLSLLNPHGEYDAKVFEGLTYSDVIKFLPEWIKNAGIKKHFTFHGFRHTFATLQLTSGTDIYTVSKLLGHKDVKTTEVYVRIVDELTKKASEKIKLDLNEKTN